MDHPEKQRTIISAHCCGCKAGLGESCSHVASILLYLKAAWTKINGKVSWHASEVFMDSTTFICKGRQLRKSLQYQFYFSKEN